MAYDSLDQAFGSYISARSNRIMDALITLKDVAVRYRKRQSFFRHSYYEALKNISMTVKQGETLGIIGRNGCGKSTLLRLLSGIYMPDEGSIQRKPGISASLLTLQVGFDPELSGIDNMIISAMFLGFRKKAILAKVDDIIQFSELNEFIYQPVKTYSSGMRARLGFSVAMHMNPDVLLIDEVLAVGDAQFRKKAETMMLDKFHSGQTVVLVSHASGAIKRICTRVIWIEDSTIRSEGPADALVPEYEAYRNNLGHK